MRLNWRRMRCSGAPRALPPRHGGAAGAQDAEWRAREAVARELSAAGFEFADRLQWNQLPSGDSYGCVGLPRVAQRGRQQQQEQQPHQVCIVLDGPWHRTTNGAPLGCAQLRDRVLRAQGLRVVTLPLRLWAGPAADEQQRQQRRAFAEELSALLSGEPLEVAPRRPAGRRQ